MARKYYRKSRSNIFGIFFVILFLSYLIIHLVVHFIVPLSLIGGAIVGIHYYFKSKNKRKLLETEQTAERIQHLKWDIKQADQQVNYLKQYAQEKKIEKYTSLSEAVLSQLDHFQQELIELKGHIDSSVSHRIQRKIEEVRSDIQLQLQQFKKEKEASQSDKEERRIEEFAPELLTFYKNIQTDHRAILTKIAASKSGNKEELTAEHEMQMTRFYDILEGYLKIKEEPKNYYNAQQRLENAYEAIHTFDENLDETLRQLNETDLHDFEVSLRILKHETTNHRKEEEK